MTQPAFRSLPSWKEFWEGCKGKGATSKKGDLLQCAQTESAPSLVRDLVPADLNRLGRLLVWKGLMLRALMQSNSGAGLLSGVCNTQQEAKPLISERCQIAVVS